jgi:hypothetical protein
LNNLEHASEENGDNLGRVSNVGGNNSLKCISSKFKDINKPLQLIIKRKNLATEAEINNKFIEIINKQCNVENATRNINKACKSLPSSKRLANNNMEIDPQIAIEKISNFCTNARFSKPLDTSVDSSSSIITATNRKKQLKLNRSTLKR